MGIIAGYIVGGFQRFQNVERFGLVVLVCLFGGIITALVIGIFVPPDSSSIILSIIAFTGGGMLGMVINWAPAPQKSKKLHIIYEPEDDDAFDREIEEALKSEYD